MTKDNLLAALLELKEREAGDVEAHYEAVELLLTYIDDVAITEAFYEIESRSFCDECP